MLCQPSPNVRIATHQLLVDRSLVSKRREPQRCVAEFTSQAPRPSARKCPIAVDRRRSDPVCKHLDCGSRFERRRRPDFVEPTYPSSFPPTCVEQGTRPVINSAWRFWTMKPSNIVGFIPTTNADQQLAIWGLAAGCNENYGAQRQPNV